MTNDHVFLYLFRVMVIMNHIILDGTIVMLFYLRLQKL